MSIIQQKIIVMFVMMMIGFLCGKLRLIDGETNKKLSNLLLLLINPLLTFMSYQTAYSADIVVNLGFTLLLSAVFFAVQMTAAALVISKKRKDFDVERLSVVLSNCGFVGIPLVQSIFGAEGVIYLTVFLTVFNIVAWTYGVSVMTGKISIKTVLRGLSTPAVISVLLGLLFFFLRIRLPDIIAEPLNAVGGMNTPFAMLVAGATLAGTNLLKCLKKPMLYVICALKLLVLPGLCALCAVPISMLGAGAEQITVAMIAAACPSAAITTMFAHRYGRNSLYASEAFALTTLFSIITIPLIMRLLTLLGIAA